MHSSSSKYMTGLIEVQAPAPSEVSPISAAALMNSKASSLLFTALLASSLEIAGEIPPIAFR